jgi:hypothetical protein
MVINGIQVIIESCANCFIINNEVKLQINFVSLCLIYFNFS